MKSKYFVFILLFAAGLFGGNEIVKRYTQSQATDINAEAKTRFNTHAENFSLPDIEGVQHTFSEWDGKVRVLNFWATWCPPCRRETPMFVNLQSELGEKGLQFVGVAIDDKEKVKDFIDTYGINYPMLIGSEEAIEVAKKYGNKFGALPYTVVINREGKIVHAQGGEFKREKAEKIIASLL